MSWGCFVEKGRYPKRRLLVGFLPGFFLGSRPLQHLENRETRPLHTGLEAVGSSLPPHQDFRLGEYAYLSHERTLDRLHMLRLP